MRKSKVPTWHAWQALLNDASSGLQLEHFDLSHHNGYLPAMLAGKSTGFELRFGPVSELNDLDVQKLAGRDCYARFVTHADLTELDAAALAAAALAKASEGIYYDGDSYRTIDDVFALSSENATVIATMNKHRAQKDLSITNLRCPHCGAPCPSYRKSCKVCRKATRTSV